VVRRRPSGTYRTDSGMVFRVAEAADGELDVEVLKDEVWVRGRVGMVGLRLESSTTMLSASAIRALPT